jgi:hypothetical protein
LDLIYESWVCASRCGRCADGRAHRRRHSASHCPGSIGITAQAAQNARPIRSVGEGCHVNWTTHGDFLFMHHRFSIDVHVCRISSRRTAKLPEGRRSAQAHWRFIDIHVLHVRWDHYYRRAVAANRCTRCVIPNQFYTSRDIDPFLSASRELVQQALAARSCITDIAKSVWCASCAKWRHRRIAVCARHATGATSVSSSTRLSRATPCTCGGSRHVGNTAWCAWQARGKASGPCETSNT